MIRVISSCHATTVARNLLPFFQVHFTEYTDIFLMIMVFLCNYKLKIISSGMSGNMLAWHKSNKGKKGKKKIYSVKSFMFASSSLIKKKP